MLQVTKKIALISSEGYLAVINFRYNKRAKNKHTTEAERKWMCSCLFWYIHKRKKKSWKRPHPNFFQFFSKRKSSGNKNVSSMYVYNVLSVSSACSNMGTGPGRNIPQEAILWTISIGKNTTTASQRTLVYWAHMLPSLMYQNWSWLIVFDEG